MSRAARGRKGARQDDPKPSRRQETLKATSEHAQQARRRAQEIFLSMIEGPVKPKVFIAKARYINPEVYDDVVVERAVAGLCGYPVCPNTFTDTYGSRTYVIRNNHLYDITERRNFCSNVCYEASELVRKQVLTLPLYLRDTQDADIKDVRLPCLAGLSGRHGKLVDITGGISKLDVNAEKPRSKRAFVSVDNIARESLVNWSENEADKNEETNSGTDVTARNDTTQNTVPPEEKDDKPQNQDTQTHRRERENCESQDQVGKDTDQSKTTENYTNQNRITSESTDTSYNITKTGGELVHSAREGLDSEVNASHGEEQEDMNQNTTAEGTVRGQARSAHVNSYGDFLTDSNSNQVQKTSQNTIIGETVRGKARTDEVNSNIASQVYSDTGQREPAEDSTNRDENTADTNADPDKSTTTADETDSTEAHVDSPTAIPRKSQQCELGCHKKSIEEGDVQKMSGESLIDSGNASTKEGMEGYLNGKKGSAMNVTETGTSKQESSVDPKSEAAVDPLADVLKVEAVMRQWVSFDSLRVVLGDLYVRGMLEHLGRSWDNYDTTSGLRLSVEAKARYISLCRRLDHEERQDEVEGVKGEQDKLDLDTGKQRRPTKPLPDYSQLQRQAKKQQLKVVSFFGGSDQYEEPEEEKLESIPEEGEQEKSNPRKMKSKKKESSETRDPTLPFVDSYSQAAWRQNIVVEKVTAYLHQLLEMTRLSVHEVKKLLGPLVATFHLSPANISFRPKEWRLITLILLKMLSVRYPIIQEAMRAEEGVNMQRTILSAFSLDLGYCDRVLSYLTEIQHVLSKDFEEEKTVDVSQSAQVPQKPHAGENTN